MREDTSPLKVLVVDDEKAITYSLCAILKLYKYNVRAAHSAEEALKLAEESQPDAVLSDVVMPGMNGIELATRLRERNPGCRVLLMSGQTTHHEQIQAAERRGGALTVLAKPIHPSEILAFLESCRGRKDEAETEVQPAARRQNSDTDSAERTAEQP
jgi:DNA-binding NtrC family response regulator